MVLIDTSMSGGAAGSIWQAGWLYNWFGIKGENLSIEHEWLCLHNVPAIAVGRVVDYELCADAGSDGEMAMILCLALLFMGPFR